MIIRSALSTLLLFAVAVKSAYTSGCPKACPDKWIQFQGSCYLFLAQKMNFFNAVTYCKELGGHLVSIESYEENQFLKAQLSDLKATDTWLGLSDIVVEGIFVWSGSGKILSYSDWQPGQPNNLQNIENCGIFWQANGYRWGDSSCDQLLRLVCEI